MNGAATLKRNASRSSDRLLPLLLLPVAVIALGPVLRLFAEAIGQGGLDPLTHVTEVLGRDSTRIALGHSLFTAGLGTVSALDKGTDVWINSVNKPAGIQLCST